MQPEPTGEQTRLIEQVRREENAARRAALLVELAQTYPKGSPARRSSAEQALDVARACGALQSVARALFLIAEAEYRAVNYAAVPRQCLEGLETARRIGDAWAEHKHTNLLGLVARAVGNREQAIEYMKQSLAAAQRLGNDDSLAIAYDNLGIFQADAGDFEQALEFQLKALALRERAPDRRPFGVMYTNVATSYAFAGDWEKSIEFYYRALVEHEKNNDDAGLAKCYTNLAETYLRRGKYERARHSAEQAIRSAEQAHATLERLQARLRLGEAWTRDGDYSQALGIFDENIRQARALDAKSELASSLRAKAELLVLRSAASEWASPNDRKPESAPELAEALELLHEAQNLLATGGPLPVRADVMRALGRLYGLLGEPGSAEDCFETALAQLRSPRENDDRARLYFDYGRFLVDRGRKPEGLAMVQDAARIFKRLEVIGESEAAERYLLQTGVAEDRRLTLLHSLSSLATHSLPLSEFAPRCLTLLGDALGFTDGTFFVEDGPRFSIGRTCDDAQLEPCRRGELQLSPTGLCLPLRLSGRNIGGIRLGAPATGAECAPAPGFDASFFEVVANFLSVAMERVRAQVAAVPAAAPEPGTVLPEPVYPGFIGAAPSLQELFATIEQVAPTRACVLIRGESGTGKELIARIVRQRSTRCHEEFVAINCAAIPETLLESELFGIEKGVATGVVERRGKFEQADRGTLFLDEIGDMSLVLQAKLLRVLQDYTFERVGGRKTLKVDTRIVAATNRNLEDAIAAGRFRRDLYYRLNVITLNLPPLRERVSDIPLLAGYFIARYNEEFQRRVRGFSPEAGAALRAYGWPGNVRELENVVERAVILCRNDVIGLADLTPALQQLGRPAGEETPVAKISDLRDLRRTAPDDPGAILEKNMVLAALRANRWNIVKTAEQLGISRSSLYRLLEKHKIERTNDQ